MPTTDREQYERARQRMVALIRERGIDDEAILGAVASVPRHEFVPDNLCDIAYEDGPLPIGDGQTISQPYVVALMIQAARVKSGDRVLEIGTGSGYSAAVLAAMGVQVFTVERNAMLAETARERLARLGVGNVVVKTGDGTVGLAEEAPFNAVIVTAGGPSVPQRLTEQLRVGGSLVIPVGPIARQSLLRIRRAEDGIAHEENLGSVAFVPLVGRNGWPR